MDMPPLLRRRIADRISPLARWAAARGITPDQLQWAVLGLAAGIGALLLVVPALVPGLNAALLLPAAAAVRALALAVAELLAQERPDGTARDPALREVTDAAADALLYLPLAAYPGVPAAPVVLLVVLGLLAEIAGLASAIRNGERRRDGPMNLHDRAIVFAIVGLILALDPGTGAWLPWLLLPAAGLAAVTVVQRLRALPPADR
jgi:uncharacterized membrane protein HdeD (DUF308 family)